MCGCLVCVLVLSFIISGVRCCSVIRICYVHVIDALRSFRVLSYMLCNCMCLCAGSIRYCLIFDVYAVCVDCACYFYVLCHVLVRLVC